MANKKYLDYVGLSTLVSQIKAADVAAITSGITYTNNLAGALTALTTTEKGTLVGAINEVKTNATTDAVVTITEVSTGLGDGIIKAYKVYQGGSTDSDLVGTINIPKDLVVTSGSCVKGTWDGDKFKESETGADHAIKLVIANQTDPVYINTKDLVDIYTAATGATQVQLAISDANVISASIVAGSIGETELSTSVNASLDRADASVQSVTKDTGSTENYVTITVTDGDNATIGISDAALATKIGSQYVAGETPTAAAGMYAQIQGATTSTVKDVKDVVDTLNGADTVNGSVKKQIKDAVEALDADVSGETTDTFVKVQVVEANGKVSAVTVTDKIQAVASADNGSEEGHTAAMGLAEASDVKAYVDSQVGSKNVSAEGDGVYISASAASNKVTVTGTYGVFGTSGETTTNGIAKAENVSSAIDAKIALLDATVSQTATTDGEAGTGLALSVTETDGKVTAISGSIVSITNDEITSLFTASND